MSENEYEKYDYQMIFQQLRGGHLDSTRTYLEIPHGRGSVLKRKKK